MKIEAKDAKVKNIFSRKTYTIPDYQREYSWTINEEISLFWDDFEYYLDKLEDNFFIGPLVLEGESINADVFNVIDGQQRLVTLAILMSVIRDSFKNLGEKELASGLQQYLIYRDERSKEKVTLINEPPHPFFQKRILNSDNTSKPKKEDEKLINAARDFFENKINLRINNKKTDKEKIGELEKIRDSLFNIDTVLIVSNDEADAYTIFETINTRGKNLLSLDLVKNHIVKEYPQKTGVKEPITTWKEIMKNIEKDREAFFNRFWASWYKKENESKLYRRFAKYLKKETTPFKDVTYLLNKLSSASETYKKITTPKMDDWKVNKNYQIYYSIKNIGSLFGLKVHYPFLMALIEEHKNSNIKDALLREALQLIEHFHFIFTYIMSARASGLDNKYSKFAIRLRKDKNKKRVISQLRKDLQSKLPKIGEFGEKIKDLNYIEHKNGILYILLKLENIQSPAINIEIENHSLDHFEPQSSKSKKVNNIGNIFLLEQKYNEDKDDLKPFEKWPKKKGGSGETVCAFLANNTKYKTTKAELTTLSKWSDLEINNRTNDLIKKAFNLFSKL